MRSSLRRSLCSAAVACSFASPVRGQASAHLDSVLTPRPLAPADFVVAGVPGNQPYVDISEDSARIRRILGDPRAVKRTEFQPGDSLTTWFYRGLEVVFGGISRVGINLTSPRVRTHRGLRVGDSARRVIALYGQPSERMDDDWVYEDPRERLHVISVTVRQGRVVRIFVGSLWD